MLRTNARTSRMNDSTRTRYSKFLSLVLRHQPQLIGLALDSQGWADTADLLRRCAAHGRAISVAELHDLVATSPKQRFALSDDGSRIRANQGHSVDVALGYAPATAPALLYHGTVAAVRNAIERDGLSKMQRHHVHLSPDEATARIVGGRRGAPVILRIDAAAMQRDGYVFYCSDNGVWLTEHVPPKYIRWP